MKNLVIKFAVSLLCLVSSNSFGQYSHPTVGINGEYVGSCLVSSCGPLTYTDNGGSGGDSPQPAGPSAGGRDPAHLRTPN